MSEASAEIMFYQLLGQRLAQARRARGLTQLDVAEAIGLVRGSIANIEAGRQRLQVFTAAWFANLVDMDLAEFLAGQHDQGPLSASLPRAERRQQDAAALEVGRAVIRSWKALQTALAAPESGQE